MSQVTMQCLLHSMCSGSLGTTFVPVLVVNATQVHFVKCNAVRLLIFHGACNKRDLDMMRRNFVRQFHNNDINNDNGNNDNNF